MITILLPIFVLMLAVIVFVGFVNEKTVKLPTEIALLLFSLLLSIAYIGVSAFLADSQRISVPLNILDDFLVKGFLCFMLFAGSCKISYKSIKPQLRLITLLALLTTTLSALLYGVLTFALFSLFNVQLDFLHCFLLGCIISPTDPIAAMSILRKVGLAEDIALAIEGESLFNDGVGIALFVVVSTTIKSQAASINGLSFVAILFKEVVGALAIGLLVSFVLYKLFVRTKDLYRQIFISLLAVSASYVICQYLDFSSAISAVVCGIYFASFTDKNKTVEKHFRVYYDFWTVVDNLLNSILYVLLGLTIIDLFRYADGNVLPIALAIPANIAARYLGVFASAALVQSKPQHLPTTKFTGLLTWAGLKGALSLALAVDTKSFLDAATFETVLIITFAIVMFTTLIQGLSIGRFYKARYT